MLDALSSAALDRAVTLSADVEIQLKGGGGRAPVLALLAKARAAAVTAIVKLAEVDPEDPKAVRALQNDIKCFDRIVEWLREIVADGFDADEELAAREREQLADAVLGSADDEPEEVYEEAPAP